MEKSRASGKSFWYVVSCVLFLLAFSVSPAGGQELDWILQAGGAGDDSGADVAVDGGGNSCVTGKFSGTAIFGLDGDNETELIGLGSQETFVARYAADGSLLWANLVSGAIAVGVSVDRHGNCYVTGAFGGTTVFDPEGEDETELSSVGSEAIFIAKYATDGSLLWAKQVAYGEGLSLADIGVDGAGKIYVTGYFYEPATFGPDDANNVLLTNPRDLGIFVAKYAGDGRLLWVKQVDATEESDVRAIAVDQTGNSYLTGFSDIMVFAPGENNETRLVSFSSPEVFVAKYATNGRLLWVRNVLGDQATGESALGYGIAVDGFGNSYVTGVSYGAVTFAPGEANATVLTPLSRAGDLFVAKYAADGRFLWVRQAGETVARGFTVAADHAGNSYVTGLFSSAVFGPGEANETRLTSASSNGIFVAKFASEGDLLWARHLQEDEKDILFSEFKAGIAVDDAGNSYITGSFYGSATFDVGGAGETGLTSFGASDIFVAKYAFIASEIDSLIDTVEGLDLSPGLEHSLLAKLRNARKFLESSNPEQRENAINILQVFINEVEAQRGEALTEEQADQLIDGAWEIMGGL